LKGNSAISSIEYNTLLRQLGKTLQIITPFHNQNPSLKTVGRTPSLALHQWVSIDTWSVAAVTWDEPIFLQMGLI
jgi:hypothetical protein